MEAILGGSRVVPTIRGPAHLSIPPFTQHDTVLTLPGELILPAVMRKEKQEKKELRFKALFKRENPDAKFCLRCCDS